MAAGPIATILIAVLAQVTASDPSNMQKKLSTMIRDDLEGASANFPMIFETSAWRGHHDQ